MTGKIHSAKMITDDIERIFGSKVESGIVFKETIRARDWILKGFFLAIGFSLYPLVIWLFLKAIAN